MTIVVMDVIKITIILINIGHLVLDTTSQDAGEGPANCVWCDVTDNDYQRGWIHACRTFRVIRKQYKRCYPTHYDYFRQHWSFRCVQAYRTVQAIQYSCCPLFTRQYAWCILPPKPVLTLPATNVPNVHICGVSKYPNSGRRLTYIFGGLTSLPHEFPWQVSIRVGVSTKSGHLCGGCIISDTLILTAAHCAYYYKAFPTLKKYVVVGDFDRDQTEDSQATYDIVDVIIHPGYNRRTVEYDIALLRLESAIHLNDDVQPVCLPHSANSYTGTDVIVSGWGSRQFGGAPARMLQYAHMRVMSNAECNQRLRIYGVSVTNHMLCTTDGGTMRERDACSGDSGGPLVFQEPDGRYTLIGLVSWGLGCAIGTPGVYTRVTEFTDWIQQYH